MFAILALAVVFMLGVPTGATRTVEEVVPGSPAASAGLQPGDEIVAVNGADGRGRRPGRVDPRGRRGAGHPHGRARRHDGDARGTPQAQEDGTYRLGFAFGLEYESYGPLEAIGLAFETTWEVTKAIGASLGAHRHRLGPGRGGERRSASRPVSSESLEAGFRYYLQVLALHQPLARAPQPAAAAPLDGGHIAFSIAERIRGRAIPREAYERFSMVGIALVLLLFVIGLSNDIDRLRGG